MTLDVFKQITQGLEDLWKTETEKPYLSSMGH